MLKGAPYQLLAMIVLAVANSVSAASSTSLTSDAAYYHPKWQELDVHLRPLPIVTGSVNAQSRDQSLFVEYSIPSKQSDLTYTHTVLGILGKFACEGSDCLVLYLETQETRSSLNANASLETLDTFGESSLITTDINGDGIIDDNEVVGYGYDFDDIVYFVLPVPKVARVDLSYLAESEHVTVYLDKFKPAGQQNTTPLSDYLSSLRLEDFPRQSLIDASFFIPEPSTTLLVIATLPVLLFVNRGRSC